MPSVPQLAQLTAAALGPRQPEDHAAAVFQHRSLSSSLLQMVPSISISICRLRLMQAEEIVRTNLIGHRCRCSLAPRGGCCSIL